MIPRFVSKSGPDRSTNSNEAKIRLLFAASPPIGSMPPLQYGSRRATSVSWFSRGPDKGLLGLDNSKRRLLPLLDFVLKIPNRYP